MELRTHRAKGKRRPHRHINVDFLVLADKSLTRTEDVFNAGFVVNGKNFKHVEEGGKVCLKFL
jgi:hypothetical protein